MAVLNPVLSILESGKEEFSQPISVTLLSTKKSDSERMTQKIKNFLLSLDSSKIRDVRTIRVSESLSYEDGLPPAHVALKSIWDDTAYLGFNIAGGMNFQVAASLYLAAPRSLEILYPELYGIHRIGIEDAQIKYHDFLSLPKPVKVLELQGVKYSVAGTETGSFRNFLSMCNCRLPKGMPSVYIGGIRFDYVWNSGNNLSFLKIFLRSFYGKDRQRILDDGRKLLSFAHTRSASDELFHRTILVYTDIPSLAQRFNEESKGKIQVFRTVHEFRRYLSGSEQKITLKKIRESVKVGSGKEGPVLYVALGRDLFPTLIAVWTYMPKKVVFFYTPGDPVIESYKEALVANGKLLPVDEVAFFETSIVGDSILDYEEDWNTPEKRYACVTPGTKGQTAFLSLMAKKHRFSICSLKTDQEVCEEIPSGERRKLTAPDPLELLTLSGKMIVPTGETTSGDELQKDRDVYETILDFLRSIPGSVSIITVMRKGFETQNAVLEVYHEEERIRLIRKKDNRVFELLTQNNRWFENLIGYVMLLQGADSVTVRIPVERLDKTGPMTEIDVVARFRSIFFVISCKAGKYRRYLASSEVSSASRVFGRFAIPLIASLFYGGPPCTVKDAFLFGYRTFTNHKRMEEFLNFARQQLKTRESKLESHIKK